MTAEEAVEKARPLHPDCTYVDWDNGMNALFQLTYVVKFWRNEECYLAGDPPKYVEQRNWLQG